MKYKQIPAISLLFLLVLVHSCSIGNLDLFQKSQEITLMSYNVRHGVSFDWEPNLEQQAEVIKQQLPDWVGLQEIDSCCERSGHIDQAAKFGELTGMQSAFGSFMEFDDGEYGLAALSRFEVVSTEVLRMPDGMEPRVAIIQVVKLDRKTKIALINIHLDWTKTELRVPQADKLLRRLDELKLPAVVIGDYNAEPLSPTLELFESYGFQPVIKHENRFTFDAKNPTVEIDHVYYRGTKDVIFEPVEIKVLEEKDASDHRPVVARLKVISK